MERRVEWIDASATSPHISHPIPIVTAKDVPYNPNSNRLQNLSLYLPHNPSTKPLIGTHSTELPNASSSRWVVYIHGGAWRDPLVTAASIESTVAHAFSSTIASPISIIASLNYSLSPHPSHSTHPYDPAKGDQNDASREVQHPAHIRDVVAGLNYLRDTFGLSDDGYILVGHSCGATLALQATLSAAEVWGAARDPPRPAAVVGLNGLYDLPLLLSEPSTHAHLRDLYSDLLNSAFGTDESVWEAASPARFKNAGVRRRDEQRKLPGVIMLAQSKEDQLVPMNQTEAMEEKLGNAATGVRVIRGAVKGLHNEVWEGGLGMWEIMQDVLRTLGK